MKARFWGVRGSIPAPGPRTARYGGNTACVEIRAGGALLIVDAGTGLRALGSSLMEEAGDRSLEGRLFIGHTHWDHIQGFPFFAPLYRPGNRFTIYGLRGMSKSLLDAMAGQMQPTYFPVQLQDLACRPDFIELSEPVLVSGVKVSYHYLNHPGVAVGYRFEHEGRVLSYISDHEPYAKLNAQGDFSAKEDAAIARFVAGSDLLICEAQYTPGEYAVKRGWGHSTFEDVLDLAQKAAVKRLALFHHDPLRDDDAMDALQADCQARLHARGLSIDAFAAREGMTIAL